jgi:hypothetical protein
MDPSPLAGQTALVTGGAKRLGRAIALALADRGVHVVLHYGHSADEAQAVVAALRAKGVRAGAVQANLEVPEQVEPLFAEAVEVAGPIGLLVNGAGVFPPSRLADFTTTDLMHAVQINALAPVQLARALAAQGRPGSVVNLLDARSLTDYDGHHVAYDASKRLLHTFTCMMAREFAPRVRVNAIAPGLILPPSGEDESYLRRLAPANPLQAVGSAGDILRALFYLLDSPFVTGQVLYVDGGRHLRGAIYG